MVCQDNQDTAIQAFLAENPSATYEPRLERELSPDPIITVKTQPLPNFCLDPTLSNLNIRLIDYGSGEIAFSFFLYLLGIHGYFLLSHYYYSCIDPFFFSIFPIFWNLKKTHIVAE